MKNLSLLMALFAIVMLANLPILSFNMVYQEQATIYLANQAIQSWRDLLNIYLHPTWLDINITFFRPSGHFLIYQLLMPLVGWNNLLGLNIICFGFLTLAGFFLIKLYQLLFPSYKAGAYIAFAIYLMHPALSISRLTFMHFDFAYVFFAILSLYMFVLFCQKKNIAYFISALFVYILAVTFKEPAIMLGPVLFIYYCLFHSGEKKLLHDKSALLILTSITLTSMLLGGYLFLSWPSLQYAGTKFDILHTFGTANAFFKDIFGLGIDVIPFGRLPFEDFAWRTTIFPAGARIIMWIFLFAMLFIFYNACRNKITTASRKSLLFLLTAALLFMLLPLSWGTGAPWHHSLTLVCLCMIMGFSAEYFLTRINPVKKYIVSYSLIISLLIVWTGVIVHFENTIKYYLLPTGFLGLSVNRNAVIAPPDIRSKLNNESILVVEDSILHNDYFLGNSAYPFLLFFTKNDYNNFKLRQTQFHRKFHHTYNGSLFRFAYLMPELKEELYPFNIEYMDDIPNEIIYNWLRHANNIFCVGYDASGTWHDKTTVFKLALTEQQKKRKLIVRDYQTSSITFLPDKIAYVKSLPFPDNQLCEFVCDQDKNCKRFIFKHVASKTRDESNCYFTY